MVASLAFSWFFSASAPCGRWLNTVFDAQLWYENDPSGSYIASAHELFSGESPLFPGHPGTPLQLALVGIQGAFHALAAPEGMSFTEFTARRIDTVVFYSKLFATLLHLVSFVALYRLATELLRNRRAAMLATLAYATSFPVLYYLSRVSVEPMMVLFFCATMLAVWRAHGSFEPSTRSTTTSAGTAWSAIAAVLAVSGLVTKLHFLGPLPLFGGLALLYGGKLDVRARIRAATAYVVAGVVALAAYSLVIDWNELIDLWTRVGKVRESGARDTSFLPGATPGGLFLLCELLLVVIGIVGWVRFLRTRPEQRARTLWISAYVAYSLAIWGYRVAARGGDFRCFHYLFLFVAFLALFAGDLTHAVLRRLTERLGGARFIPFTIGTLWLILLHGVSVAAAVDTRRYDAAEFERIADVHELVASLAPGERVALTTGGGWSEFRRLLTGLDKGGSNIHGLSARYAPDERRSSLMTAYAELFVLSEPNEIPADARTGTLSTIGAYAVIER